MLWLRTIVIFVTIKYSFTCYLYETRGVVVAIALNIAARVRRVVIPIVTLPGT